MRYFKLLLTLFLINFVLTSVNAQPCDPSFSDDCSLDGNPTGTPGARAVPIDDYAGILIIAGVVAAGAIYSKKEKLNFKK